MNSQPTHTFLYLSAILVYEIVDDMGIALPTSELILSGYYEWVLGISIYSHTKSFKYKDIFLNQVDFFAG